MRRLLLGTNVLVRHLTHDHPKHSRRATALLASPERFLLTDVVFAETVYVLQSVYRAPPPCVAQVMRAALGHPTLEVERPARLLRAVEVYEQYRVDFADAYLVAVAEESKAGAIASFDRSLDRVPTVERVEP
ncbi:MAG TPA: type II toxin-antitoxin system VapC family toxin [Gaiellaceae bacterium]|nr:type II toxin-antitoxin system VapC family toxin [Gaiellaceae bacterium]